MSYKSEYKCRDCFWLDTEKRSTIGYECINKNIKHIGLGNWKYASSPACKMGFRLKETQNEDSNSDSSDNIGSVDMDDKVISIEKLKEIQKVVVKIAVNMTELALLLQEAAYGENTDAEEQ